MSKPLTHDEIFDLAEHAAECGGESMAVAALDRRAFCRVSGCNCVSCWSLWA